MTVLRALRAEWTKFWSVRSSGLALLLMVLLTLGLSTLAASLSHSDAYEHPLTYDQFHFVHQPIAGDATLTARVASQTNTAPWAKAGIIVKASTTPGAPYVALMVTPAHGVRLIADAKTELAKTGLTKVEPATTGAANTTTPRWLRLTRAGQAVTGAESADGTTWSPVGTVTVPDLPSNAQAGMFVASPPTDVAISMRGQDATVTRYLHLGEAVFDNVAVESTAGPATGAWHDDDVTPAPLQRGDPEPGPDDIMIVDLLPGSSSRDSDGRFTIKGSGDLGYVGVGGVTIVGPTDVTKQNLVGAYLGLTGAVVLGVLFMTSEYRTGMIGTTLAASPRRGRVLAAKAVVLAGVTFVAGLLPSFAIFFIAPPLQRSNGYRPPVFPPTPSITDPGVLRAIVGTAAFLALIGLFSLAVGAVLRHTAAAVMLLLGLLVVVPTVASGTSDSANTWISRVTPFAGLAIQQTIDIPSETKIGPWAGFAVLCGYTAIALTVAYWLLKRRDA